jgi:hypothetical protein
MNLLKNRALAVGIGAAIIVTGANLTANAAGGHGLFGGHHAAGAAHHSSGAVHVYKYVIPKHTQVPFSFQAKDLPKGRYAVTLSIATATSFTGSPLASPFCSVSVAHNPNAVFSYGIFSNDPTSFDVAINTGSGLAKVAKDGGASVACFGADRTYSNGHSTNLVTFTPISRLTVGKVHRLVLPSKVASGGHFGR